eukprot:scaffold31158_cov49-Phaeocystis_antarctica.AAC.5
MPACGERVGGSSIKGGGDRFGCTCSGKVLGRYRGMMQTNGARSTLFFDRGSRRSSGSADRANSSFRPKWRGC